MTFRHPVSLADKVIGDQECRIPDGRSVNFSRYAQFASKRTSSVVSGVAVQTPPTLISSSQFTKSCNSSEIVEGKFGGSVQYLPPMYNTVIQLVTVLHEALSVVYLIHTFRRVECYVNDTQNKYLDNHSDEHQDYTDKNCENC